MVMNKKSNRLVKSLLITFLVSSWLFSGWPGIWITPNFRFPPKINEAQAAITYNNSGTFTAGTGAITPPYPASMVANDICLLVVTSENQAITLTTANGFAEVPTWSPQSAGTAATDPASRLAVFWKRTVGGDSAPVVADSGNNTEGIIHCFSGVITSGNPWDTGAGGNDTAQNDTTGNIPGATTTMPNDLVVLIESTSNNGTSTTNCSGWTNANLSSLTELQDNSNTAGLGGGSCMATGVKATAGTYATTTVTMAATTYKGAISLALKPQNTTTLADGTNPGNASLGPGGATTDLDAFTLATDNSTDTVNSLTATLSPAGSYNNIDHVDLTDNANTIKCSVSSLASDTLNFSTCGLSITTSATTFKLRVTPKSHANMPAPSLGQSYDTTGTITSWTSVNGNTQAGSDAGSAIVTIDNLSPNAATSVSGSAGNTYVTLNWTSSSSTDFDTTNGSVILRWTGGSAGSEVPAEGNSSYVAGNSIAPTATVACVISSATSTALSKIDGTGGSAGCLTTALTNGQAYTYKVFQRDINGNYDTGTLIGSFTPSVASSSFTQNKYLWYVDNDLADPIAIWGTPDLTENQAITVIPAGKDPPDATQKLRLRVNMVVNTADLPVSTNYFKLEFKAGTDGSCTTGSWTDVGTGAWSYATSTVTDGANITALLSDTTTGKGEQYVKSKGSGTSLNHVGATTTQIIEYDFPIIGSSAASDTTYSFRVVGTNSAGSTETVFDAYTNCPTLTTEPGTSDLMRHGNVFTNGSEQGFFWAN